MTCPILVVDDDPDLQEAIRNLLTDEGYDAVGAANGREALDMLQRPATKPCLILLDLMMPIMNGWEMLEHLATEPELRLIPVAIMSACLTPQRPENQGLLDELDFLFLRKPLRVETLLGVVAEKCSASGPAR